MLSASEIRIVFALLASLAVHGMLLSLDTGKRQSHSFRAPAKTVTFNLVSRQPVPHQAETRETLSKAERAVVRKVEPVPPETEQKAEQEIVREEKPQQLPVPVREKVTVDDIPPVAPQAGDIEPESQIYPETGQIDEPKQSAEARDPGFVDVIMAKPLYRRNPPPQYPEKARRRNLQGTVILEVDVSTEGKVDHLQIRESCGHRILDHAAMAAVRKWIFEPGTRNGVQVGMTVLVPVRFVLQ